MTLLMDRLRLPSPWVKMKSPASDLLYKLSNAEDQEEIELFLFRLYCENKNDLNFFGPSERERIEGFLRFLIEDTQHHKSLIADMIEEVKAIGEANDE